MTTQQSPGSDSANRPLTTGETKLRGGILGDRCAKNIDNLFLRIDIENLKKVFAATHDPWYAEPEFVGKYLDTAAQIHGTTGNPDVLRRAREVARAAIGGQREDGYLGTYHRGLEFDPTFGIWNQAFLIWGLTSYYKASGDEAALAAAVRCADYLSSNFMRPGGPDLLDTINQCIQHSCILYHMAELYKVTQEPRHLDFCNYIVERWESSTLRLVSRPSIFRLGCIKAIEMLICYQGLVRLGRIVGREEYIEAAARYWKEVADSQIGTSGNGSINEMWTYSGNRPLSVHSDLHPNENCVAVGWMKLSAELFAEKGGTEYFDAFERTLYNHLLGAQALDGSDFSYYQGLIGRKIHATNPGMYSCCRYRGMNMLARLPKYVVWEGHDGLTINLYAGSDTETRVGGVLVRLVQETNYPRDGKVRIQVTPGRAIPFVLRLRVPSWSKGVSCRVNQENVPAPPDAPYLEIKRTWRPEGDAVELNLPMPIAYRRAMLEDVECGAAFYGPLLLALDTRYGAPLDGTEVDFGRESLDLKEIGPETGDWTPIVRFGAAGRVQGKARSVTLVDYASAGSVDNRQDRFRVWIPAVAP